MINLNQGMYLELLAADATNTKVRSPRWMGVDLLTKNQITRWALKSDTLEKDSVILKKYHQEMGEIRGGSRNSEDGSLLQWELIMPLAAPEIELVPFLLDWSTTEKHPSELLPEMNCTLVSLYGTHPNPDELKTVFKALDYDLEVRKAANISIKMVMDCPMGIIEI